MENYIKITEYFDVHIISAQLSECGLTLAQRTVDGKSNEIPAVQELLKEKKIGAVQKIKYSTEFEYFQKVRH